MSNIKSYNQVLGPQDVDGCAEIENAAFPEGQRATREKFEYRLARCGDICFGTFTNVSSSEAASSDDKVILAAHIVSTKSHNVHVKDDDMAIPPDWKTATANSPLGHQDNGRTVQIHSLAVLPAHQSRGFGKGLLKAYIARIRSSGVADRISLITYDRLTGYYEKFGFKNEGESEATFGGQTWYDMVLTFDEAGDKATKKSGAGNVDG